MCMNCGCGLPHDDHGNPANITAEDLARAGEANDQSLRESAQHILETDELLDASRCAPLRARGAGRADRRAGRRPRDAGERVVREPNLGRSSQPRRARGRHGSATKDRPAQSSR